MPTIITTQILPNNTVKLTIAFTDEDGTAATPNDPTTWSLKDSSGNVVNSRDQVDITEVSSVDVVLTGADLASLGANDDGIREVHVEGTYDSNAGSDLSLNAVHAFVIGDVLLPVSLGDVKRNLIIDDDNTADDYLLAQFITEARQEVERVLDRKLITQTVTEYWDGWPGGRELVLPYGNLQSVTSLRYRDEDGDWQTVSSSDYIVQTEDDPGRIVLDDDADWPTETLYESKPIEVVYSCGYGSAFGSVPFAIRRGIMLMVNEMYENRDPVVTGTIVKRVYDPLKSLKYAYGIFGVR
jgi:uncharacterized phiE125 gp8 family phage protein